MSDDCRYLSWVCPILCIESDKLSRTIPLIIHSDIATYPSGDKFIGFQSVPLNSTYLPQHSPRNFFSVNILEILERGLFFGIHCKCSTIRFSYPNFFDQCPRLSVKGPVESAQSLSERLEFRLQRYIIRYWFYKRLPPRYSIWLCTYSFWL